MHFPQSSHSPSPSNHLYSRSGGLGVQLRDAHTTSSSTINNITIAVRSALSSPTSSLLASSLSSPSPSPSRCDCSRGGRAASRCLSKLLDAAPDIVDQCLRSLGPLFAGGAWSLILLVAYVYFSHVLPLWNWSSFSFPAVFITPIGLFFLFNILYNHFKAMTTPSSVDHSLLVIPPNIIELIREERAQRSKRKGVVSHSLYCGACRIPKPPRTHHCHVCGRCQMKMDHHCPWISNCVGFGNIKFFYLFMLYLLAGCGFIVTLTFPLFFWSPHKGTDLWQDHSPFVVFAMVLCGAIFFAIGVMLIMHTFLILTNQTTIEFYHNREMRRQAERQGKVYLNPYDVGYLKNAQAVFGVGRFWFSWLLPAGPARIGSGMAFPTIYDADCADADATADVSTDFLSHTPIATGESVSLL